jgi:hypothetical protein
VEGRTGPAVEHAAVQKARRQEFVVYSVAILAWATLGIWYKPILSMVLAPFVTPLLVAYLPHQLSRRRDRTR